MKGPVYINAASCISPQQTFGSKALPSEILQEKENRLRAIEPDYKVHLNIPAARRMSRMIKMGVCAALQCLKDADVKMPGAIIAGTGLGCLEDSEKFLASLISANEQTLSPTSFIFSTHNTVAAQVALLLQCNNYNFTHTHRALSFENALLDSILFLKENPLSNVLAGAVDETTETSFTIQRRLALARDRAMGTFATGIAGEGAAFFSLQLSKGIDCLASLIDMETISFPSGEDEIIRWLSNFCKRNSLTGKELLLTGMTGNSMDNRIDERIKSELFKNNPSGRFTHLCGNYHTASAFGFWLAATMLKLRTVPQYVVPENQERPTPERIVIFNTYKQREYSIILLEQC